MKNLILATVLTFSASTGWSLTKTYTCKNENKQMLDIYEDSASGEVWAVYGYFRYQKTFYGQVSVHGYDMDPASSGIMDPHSGDQEVTLKVVKNSKYAPICGRCAGMDFPPKAPNVSYYAKLTVGNQIYDFSCDKMFLLP